MDVLRISTPFWEGEIAPEYSANLVRLQYRPAEEALLFPRPAAGPLGTDSVCCGIPVMLPPNRTDRGEFSFEGRRYRLPLNQPETGCNIHGLTVERGFHMEHASPDNVLLSWEFDESFPEFAGFPHRFRLELGYRFDGPAFSLVLNIQNRSDLTMPFGVGFHTAFALPAEEAEARLEIPHAGSFWQVHPQRRLPSGGREAWPREELEIFGGERTPAGYRMGRMFPLEAAPHVARIRRRAFTAEYRFDEKFNHLACWNGDGRSGLFCIEPMSWMTDAPNMPLPPEVTGVRGIRPGETLSFFQEIRVTEPAARR